MYILNLFIVPVILISLFFKIRFSYVVSLLVSLTAATFVYREVSLGNILFTIAIFNLTPWICWRFNLIFRQSLLSLKARRDSAKSDYEQMLKGRSLIRQSNAQLGKETSEIVELYQMTADMSAVLEFEEISEIFCKKLMENARFNSCRMILVDEDAQTLKIRQVFELKYAHPHLHPADVEPDDMEILKETFRAQKTTFIEEKSHVYVPLMAESKFLGALAIEGLSIDAMENFTILVTQFSLEFRRIRLYQKIQQLAITDGLTALFVRRYFLERLDEEMKRSARHNLHLAFLMVDIDHFKQCNDNFGHLTGDAILREIAKIIKAGVREIDLVGRFGGEEFSVLLPDTDKEDAREAAERIRMSVDQHKFYAYDETIKTEVSIGVAGFPEDSTVAQSLIDKSDQALYRAKQQGRNRVCVFAQA